jgi:NADPH:quinone reductase-like Zn-dependent oxidoreductase
MGALTAWQGLIVHGALQGERVLVAGSSGGVGHIAVQLARHAGAAAVDAPAADLVFDTVGGDVAVGVRTVSIVVDTPGATYFVVEPDRSHLVEIARLAEAGELVPAIDSTFPLECARSAFDRVAARRKRGKVVLDVAGGIDGPWQPREVACGGRTGWARPGSPSLQRGGPSRSRARIDRAS